MHGSFAHVLVLLTLQLGAFAQEAQPGADVERGYLEALRQAELSPENRPHRIAALNNLAMLYRKQGRYREAQPLLERAVTLAQSPSVPADRTRVAVLKNLGLVYLAEARLEDAERLFLRALSVSERLLGPEHLDTVGVLHELAALAYDRQQYTKAERLFTRVLAAREKVLGPHNPDVATAIG